MTAPAPPRTRRALTAVAILLPLLAGVMFGAQRVVDGERTPTEIDSSAPTFGTLDELVRASDLVVQAEVVDAGTGRTISDPADPTSGIRTRLGELRVVRTLRGSASESVLLEEEASLLDGTPVIVDGVRPVEVGERGVFFLVAGTGEAAPYHTLVGPQGRYLVVGDVLEPSGTDDLSTDLAEAGGPVLVDLITSVK